MKAMFAVLLVAMAVGFSQVKAQNTYPYPRCNVGADPVNPNRQPTADEEVVINPADKLITYKSGNGRNVTCVLQVGVPIVINKTTGVAVWVFGCGNDITTPWIPKRMPTPQGVMGPQGPQGSMGPAGPRGPAGDKGDRGDPVPLAITTSSSWCGSTCRWLVGAGIVAGAIAIGEHNDWWRDHKGPAVTSDDSGVICTGDPCPGAPTVGARKMGGFSFAFPIH